MYTETTEALLDDFVASSDEIQGAVMVSTQGQLLTNPVGFSEESTRTLAGSMLYLVVCLSEHCQWHTVNWVTIRAQEGYLIVGQCGLDAFLLIKTTAVPTGDWQNLFLQHLEKLQTALQFPNQDATVLPQNYRPIELNNRLGASSTTNGPLRDSQDTATSIQRFTSFFPLSLKDHEIAYCQRELTERIGPIAAMICENTIQHTPDLSLSEFINALAKYIPDQQAALEFQKRLMTDIPPKNY